jgi:hypothetical protein
VLIKYTALPLLPLAAIAVFRRQTSRTARIKTTVISMMLTAGIAALSLAPFFDIPALWHAFQGQRGIFVTSLPQIVLRASNEYNWGFSTDAIESVSSACVAFTVLVACVWVWRSPVRWIDASYTVMFVLLLVGTPNLRPWYVVWLIPLAIAAGTNGPWLRTIIWSAAALVSYAHYIWIREWWPLSSFWFEVTGVAILLLPVLAAMVVEWWLAKGRRPSSRATHIP